MRFGNIKHVAGMLLIVGVMAAMAFFIYPFHFLARYKNFVNDRDSIVARFDLRIPDNCYYDGLKYKKIHGFICPKGREVHSFALAENNFDEDFKVRRQYRTGEYFLFSKQVSEESFEDPGVEGVRFFLLFKDMLCD